jgi:galactose mutarotase-like enzyme
LDALVLEHERIRVEVNPEYGARVTSLLDTHTSRQWMTAGGRSADTGEGAVYRGDEAVGWDECFPTVGTWDASATAWRRRLRDHGDLWGRRWTVDSVASGKIALSYADRQFRFARELAVAPATLTAVYRIDNLGAEPLPWLWALHALLALEPDDRMDLTGVDAVDVAFLARAGARIETRRLPWSGPNDVLPHPLSAIQPRDSLLAGKFYATGLPGGRARIGQPGRALEISWDASISDLGIWLTYGAWPEPGGHYEVALEPTSAPADHVGQVIAAGTSMLQPGANRSWTVTLRITD